MNRNEKLDWGEALDIADFITKTKNEEGDYAASEFALQDKWSIDADTFHEIAGELFQMMRFGVSPLTGTPYIGFANGDMFFAKKEISESYFLGAIIEWATSVQEIPGGGSTLIKVTNSKTGESEYDFIIARQAAKEPPMSEFITEITFNNASDH